MRRFLCMLLVFTLCFSSINFSFAAPNDKLEINLRQTVDGIGPFDTEEGKGKDKSDNNNIVRTLDSVTYTLDYSVRNQGETATDCYVKGIISLGNENTKVAVWSEDMKTANNITISDDGLTFVYNFANLEGGNAYTKIPVAKALGSAKDGDAFSVVFEIGSSNFDAVRTDPKSTTISALPRMDLELIQGRQDSLQGPNGNWGKLISYSIVMSRAKGKGSEAIKTPITFTADLSQFGINNALLYNTNDRYVGLNGEGVQLSGAPYGKKAANRPDEKCVEDSGSITATQAAAGANIDFTVNGIDFSSDHRPTESFGGSTIAVDKNYVFSGYFTVFVYNEDLKVASDALGRTNVPVRVDLTGFAVKGISDTDNFGTGNEEVTSNNGHGHDITYVPPGDEGSFGYRIDIRDGIDGSRLPTMTDDNAGDALVVAGQKIRSQAYVMSESTIGLSKVQLVSKWDPEKLELKLFENKDVAYIVRTEGSNIEIEDWIFEYGIGEYRVDEIHREGDIKSVNDSKLGVWYGTYAEAKALEQTEGKISMVRARLRDGKDLGHRAGVHLSLNLEVAENMTKGTVIPVYASAYAFSASSGTGKWRNGSYKMGNNEGVGYGQRATLTDVICRIDKKELNSKSTVDITTGEKVVTFVLTPSFTGPPNLGTNVVVNQVTITDKMPKGLTYKKRAGSIEPTSVNVSNDGVTTLVWALGDVSLNNPLPIISYDAVVEFNLKTGDQLTNTVVIDSPADLSAVDKRTSQAALTVTNDNAWGIKEYVEEEIVEIDEVLNYKVKYQNFTATDLSNVMLVSAVPFTGNGTNYVGNFSLMGIDVSNGETVFITDSAATIDLALGADNSAWTPYDAADQGALQKATGIKIVKPALSNTAAPNEITYRFKATGNRETNVYFNQTSGTSSTIQSQIFSRLVSIKTVSSTIGQVVWMDNDKDGVKDADEPGIKDVKVILTKPDASKVEAITDANGAYKFENLHSGVYGIAIDQTTLPNNVGLVYDPDATADHITEVNLGKDVDHILANFGYVGRVDLGSIGQVVWMDSNRDGIKNYGEPGIKYVQVTLTKPDNTTVSATTGDNGEYRFTNLVAGTYKVTVNTSSLPAYASLVYDPDASKDNMTTVNLVENAAYNTANFGYVQNIPSDDSSNDNSSSDSSNGSNDNSNDDSKQETNPEPVRGTLVVRHIDQSTGELLTAEVSATENVDTAYTTEQKVFEGFDFREVKGSESGKYVDGTITVTYFYLPEMIIPDSEIPLGDMEIGTLVVRHIDADTKEPLKEDVKTSGKPEAPYVTTDESFESYRLVAIPGNSAGKYFNGEIVVVYEYTKVEASNDKTELPKTGEKGLTLEYLWGSILLLGGLLGFRKEK